MLGWMALVGMGGDGWVVEADESSRRMKAALEGGFCGK